MKKQQIYRNNITRILPKTSHNRVLLYKDIFRQGYDKKDPILTRLPEIQNKKYQDFTRITK